MFNKRSRTEKDASTDAQRARIITTSFSGQGICAREGEIWTRRGRRAGSARVADELRTV